MFMNLCILSSYLSREYVINNSTTRTYAVSREIFLHNQSTVTQPTKISHKEMDGRREKKLCIGCNRERSKWHKCQESKLFTLENNDIEEIDSFPQRGFLTRKNVHYP